VLYKDILFICIADVCKLGILLTLFVGLYILSPIFCMSFKYFSYLCGTPRKLSFALFIGLVFFFFYSMAVAQAAFPAVASSNSGNSGANVTATAITMPSGVASGDLLFVLFSKDGTAAPTSITGTAWNTLSGSSSGGSYYIAYWKIADGTDSLTINHASEGTAYIVYRITGHDPNTAPAEGTIAVGTSANPNPPSLNPSSWDVEDTLWIVGYGWDGNLSNSSYPTDYASNQLTDRYAHSNGSGVAGATRNLAASSDDPGTATLSSNTEEWAAQTYAIRPLQLTAPTASTTGSSLITTTSAQLEGNVVATGNATVTIRGFEYSTDPTLNSGVSTTSTSGSYGTGSYTSSIGSLSSDTVYYYRAFATNSVGTGYGEIENFSTLALEPHTISGTLLDSGLPVGAGNTITMVIGTSTPSIHSTTTGSTGDWFISFLSSNLSSTTPIVVYLNGSTTKATTMLMGEGVLSNPTDIELSLGSVIVRGATATNTINIAAFSFYDSSDDADILYTVSGGAGVMIGDVVFMQGTIVFPTTLEFSAGYSSLVPLTFDAGTLALTGTGGTVADANLGNITVVGDYTFLNPATTTNLTINSGGELTLTNGLSITGDFAQNGSFVHNNATTTFAGVEQTVSGSLTGSNSLGSVVIAKSAAVVMQNNASTTNLVIKGEGERGTLQLLAYPTALSSTGRAVDWSNNYLAVGHDGGNFLSFYKLNPSTDTLAKLANPTTPAAAVGIVYGVAWNGDYLAVAHAGGNYLSFYKREGDTLTKLSNPTALSGIGNGVAWSGDYLAVAHEGGNFLSFYKREGDSLTKLSNPSAPAGIGRAVAWTGDYLAVAHETTPFLTLYRREGDTLTKLAAPSALNGIGTGVAWNASGDVLAVNHNAGSFMSVYTRSGDTLTRISSNTNPRVGLNNASPGSVWLDDDNFMMGDGRGARTSFFNVTGTTVTKTENKMANIAGPQSIAMNPDGYLAMAHSLGNFLTILKKTPSGQLTLATDLSVAGNYHNDGNFIHDEHTVFFDGGTNQVLSGTLDDYGSFHNVHFSGAGTKTITASTTLTGSFTIATTSGSVIAPVGLLKIFGDYLNSSTFDANGGLVAFVGTSSQNIDGLLTEEGAFADVYIVGGGEKRFLATTSINDLSLDRYKLVKLADPTALSGTGNGVAWSGDYLAVAHNSGNLLSFYKREGDTLTKLANPTALSSTGNGVAWSGDYLAVAHASGNFLSFYKRSGDTLSKLADPTALSATGNSVAWSGDYLAVGHVGGNFLSFYKRDGDTLTKLTNPTAPSGVGRSVAWNGDYLAVGHDTSPFLSFYKREGDTLTKLTNPTALSDNGRGVAWSGDYLAVAHNGGNFLSFYKRSGDTLTKLSNPERLSENGVDVVWQGDYLIVLHESGSYFSMYKRNGDTLTKVDNQIVLPDIGRGVAVNGDYLTVGHFGGNFLSFYKVDTPTTTAPEHLTINGDYSNNETIFTAGTGEVVFGGSAIQTATGTMTGTSQFYDLTITNTTGNGSTTQSVVFGAPLTATGTMTMTASSSAAFFAGATSSFNAINWQGGNSESEAWLRSTEDGVQWYVDVGTVLNVSYVNVKDSNASSTAGGILAVNSTDSGNNANWSFSSGFTMNIDTTLSAGTTITLPLRGNTDVVIHWGDGATTSVTNVNQSTNVEHTYAEEGEYTIIITGSLEQLGANSATYDNADKITAVGSFGALGLTSLAGAFRGATNLAIVPSSLPGTVTNLSRMFYGATTFNQDISGWNTTAVTNMSSMFQSATVFNQPIGSWVTGSVTNMSSMFESATAFNQDISGWNTSAVTNMSSMFQSATAFNQPIGSWVTGSVINMSSMFESASAFNQDISGWDTSVVTGMTSMFQSASLFNQDLSFWCVELIESKPSGFDTSASAWVGGSATRPQWGICPQPTPTVVTSAASVITDTTMTLNGTIVSYGTSSVTTRGFIYTTDPTFVSGVATTSETGTFGVGDYSLNISSLTVFTTYYIRAFATNPAGTIYGETVEAYTTYPPAAQVWNADDWVLYDTITINPANIDANLTDFPVYVDLADLSSQFWSITPTSSTNVGTDIRVTTDGVIPVELPREIVFASSTTLTGELHFKADSISSTTDTVFRIYYNGTTTGDYLPTETYGRNNVWTNDYLAVYHLADNPAGTAPQIIDSTGNGNNGTSSGSMTVNDSVSVQLGLGLEFDGTDDRIALGSNISNSTAVSLSAWYNAAGAGGGNLGRLFHSDRFSVMADGSDRWRVTVGKDATNGDWQTSNSGDGTLGIGSTRYIYSGMTDITNNNTDPVVIINGTVLDVTELNTPVGSTNAIGNSYVGNRSENDRAFSGLIDELRISSTTRSESWVKAEYYNQSTTTNFYNIATSSVSTMVLAEHSQGQATNSFSYSEQDEATLFAFSLDNTEAALAVTEIVLTLSNIKRPLDAENIANISLYIDENSNGVYEEGDTLIDSSGVLSVNGLTGTITFNEQLIVDETMNLIVVADLIGINNRSSLVVSLSTSGIIVVGLKSGGVSSAYHYRNLSSGAISNLFGEPPAGVEVIDGGGSGGGGSVLEEEDGENIVPDGNFKRPSSTGSPHNAWTNPSLALASDNTYATTSSDAAEGVSQSFADFGFTVPDGNTIEGIIVKVDAKAIGAGGTIDIALSWDGGETHTTVKTISNLTSSDVVYVLGGLSDKWGRAWIPGNFSNANFRVRVTGITASNTLYLDGLEVQVYAIAGGGGGGGGGSIFDF